ncbi:MAG: ferredoxin [Myxococcota bacterium]
MSLPTFRVLEDDCICCVGCPLAAPEHFAMGPYAAQVVRQPADDEEVDRCRDAAAICPVDAIAERPQAATTTTV